MREQGPLQGGLLGDTLRCPALLVEHRDEGRLLALGHPEGRLEQVAARAAVDVELHGAADGRVVRRLGGLHPAGGGEQRDEGERQHGQGRARSSGEGGHGCSGLQNAGRNHGMYPSLRRVRLSS